jgi:hypothetical protein
MEQPIENDANPQGLPPDSQIGLPVDDRESLDDELLDDMSMDDEHEIIQSQTRSRNRRSLMCFECNRPEGHFLVSGRRWFFSFLLGLTFGGILLVGPYKCQCCGSSRLMYFDSMNPRYWINSFNQRKISKGRKRSRSNRKL